MRKRRLSDGGPPSIELRTNTRVNGHEEPLIVDDTLASTTIARAAAPASAPAAELLIEMNFLDERAVDSFSPNSSPAETMEVVANIASQLSGPNRVEARVERIARLMARAEVQVANLEHTLGLRLAAADDAGFRLAERALKDARAWFISLAQEHRAACVVGGAAVLVAHADVHLEGKR